jgi:hypothetical protein
MLDHGAGADFNAGDLGHGSYAPLFLSPSLLEAQGAGFD